MITQIITEKIKIFFIYADYLFFSIAEITNLFFNYLLSWFYYITKLYYIILKL